MLSAGRRAAVERVGAPHRAVLRGEQLFLKLFGASSLGPDALDTLVAAQQQTYIAELAGLTRLRRTRADDPLVTLLIDAAIAHTKADLELLGTAAQRLAPITERTKTAPRPADTGQEEGRQGA
ncbi:hypothetical protein [Streptomyces gilvifuscus]|uniref:Transcription regulator PadR C-terminal domain-containing protein n=1 Tax=Streptomyces gilvifuscus TaxID=1550617 RepID=A0ABT5G8K1_9ACTN|nr:hypothetical protein [Streptomyces gilvifuscus]MDC2961021.1 hypothetical protein [Streptomyces gilvifuscus]